MLVIVVAMFGICWFPLHLFTLILDFYPAALQLVSMDTLSGLYISAHWLAMSNSFANPIIYGFTNESFRADLLTLLYMCCPCCFCLTNILTRQYSGSTYETVVFRRPNFYKQKSRASNGSFQSRTLRQSRDRTLFRNGVRTRKRSEYEDMNTSQRSKNFSISNGCNNGKIITKSIEKVYLRLEPSCRFSVSANSEASAEEET